MQRVNQMYPELAGTGTGLSMHIINDSSSRLMMLGGMLASMLVIKHPTRRRMITGSEAEYAKTTWDISMPVDAKIVKVIPKFPTRLGSNIKLNTETLVIFENLEKRRDNILELGCMTIKSHHSSHQSFGFEFNVVKANKNRLHKDEFVPRGTKFCISPNVTPEGNYTYGIEVPIALMSVPQIIEDGIVFSRSLCEAMTTTIMGERTGSWGKSYFPRNIYGDANTYKAHPDQGELIREDGLLFALCEYVPMHGICEMDKFTLGNPDSYDPIFDELTFAEPGAKVIDVTILHNRNDSHPPTPVGMDVQQRKYAANASEYYKNVLTVVQQYYRQEKTLQLSRELNRIVGLALIDDPKSTQGVRSVVQTYRANPIDDWNVKITYAKDVVPTIGFKVTGLHGDKAVIVDVREDDEMPLDAYGRRAMAISDADSTIKRNNVGRVYEQYVNAKSWDVTEDMRALVASGNRQAAIDHYRTYIKLISPHQTAILDKWATNSPDKLQTHIDGVLRDGVYTWLRTDNPIHSAELIYRIKCWQPARMSPVTYKGKSGKWRTTKSNVLIGSVYMLLLEKTAADFAAVSTAKRNHLGTLSKLTNSDKYSQPTREQPTRILGEAEVRALVAAVGPVMTQRLLEYPNSAVAQKIIARTIMAAPQPTNIDVVIDDSTYEPGHSASNGYVDMLHMCGGVRYARKLAVGA